MKLLGVVSVAALLIAGCTATRTARLYDLQAAAVLEATYRTNGSGAGIIFLGDKANPRCSGEYRTIAGGNTSWGTIYAGATIAQGAATSVDSAQRGQAILTCPDGLLIECEYMASATSGGGAGACRDNQKRTYRLMF